jgi:hypothetical protein
MAPDRAWHLVPLFGPLARPSHDTHDLSKPSNRTIHIQDLGWERAAVEHLQQPQRAAGFGRDLKVRAVVSDLAGRTSLPE